MPIPSPAVGVRFTGLLTPTNSGDTFAVHETWYGRGGFKRAVDITERDSITPNRREQNITFCYVESTGRWYQLVGGIANTDWVDIGTSLGGGGGSSTLQQVTDNGNTTTNPLIFNGLGTYTPKTGFEYRLQDYGAYNYVTIGNDSSDIPYIQVQDIFNSDGITTIRPKRITITDSVGTENIIIEPNQIIATSGTQRFDANFSYFAIFSDSNDYILFQNGSIVKRNNAFNYVINIPSPTTNRTVNFPNASGTLALVSDITALTPTVNLQQVTTNGNTTTNNIQLNSSQLILTSPFGSALLRCEPSSNVFQIGNGSFYAGLSLTALTTNRNYILPNKSGTIALIDDIPTINLQNVLNAGNSASNVNINLTNGDINLFQGSDSTILTVGQLSLSSNFQIRPTDIYSSIVGADSNFYDYNIYFPTVISNNQNNEIFFPSKTGTLALLSDIAATPIFLYETSTISDFQSNRIHYYVGKSNILYDYNLIPFPTPIPNQNFDIVNLSVYTITITSDGGNSTYVLTPNQSLRDIQVFDNGNGVWAAIAFEYIDNIYDLQQVTNKGNISTNPIIVRNNPDIYRTRYSTIGQEIQRTDLGYNINYTDIGIRKLQNATLQNFTINLPDISGNAPSSSVNVNFRPNVSGTVAYLSDLSGVPIGQNGEGISFSSGQFNIGGGLNVNGNRQIRVEQGSPSLIFVQSTGTGGESSFGISSGSAELRGSGDGTYNSRFYVSSVGTANILSSKSGSVFDITIDGNIAQSFIINSNRSDFAGLTYSSNYSSNFINRSLVDKQYVDSSISGINNFLPLTGNSFSLNPMSGNIIFDENSFYYLQQTQNSGDTRKRIGFGDRSAYLESYTMLNFLTTRAEVGESSITLSSTYDDGLDNFSSFFQVLGTLNIIGARDNAGLENKLFIGNDSRYENQQTPKTGIRYIGFGEININGDNANYSTLLGTSLVPKKYVDDAISGFNISELPPVIAQTNNPPSTPSNGDRYLIGVSPTGAWVGRANQIAEWSGSAWVYTIPINNNTVFVTNTLTTLRFNGTTWVAYQGTAILQNGNSLAASIVLGSNDNNTVSIKTNNIIRATYTTANTVEYQNGFSLIWKDSGNNNRNVLNMTADNLTLNNGTSTGNLTISTVSGSTRINTNGIQRLNIDSAGNFNIRQATITNNTAFMIKAVNVNSTDGAFSIQRSSDTSDLFVVRNDGALQFGSLSVGRAAIRALNGNISSISIEVLGVNNNEALRVTSGNWGLATSGDIMFITSGLWARTSGEANGLRIGYSISPNSGNATDNLLNINPTINQTSTANGIIRGMFINPITTSVLGEFRGIEINNGSTSNQVGIKFTNSSTGLTPLDGSDITLSNLSLLIRNRENSNILFLTNNTQVLTIASTGLLSSNVSNYETLVLANNDIPNKLYVDTQIANAISGAGLTELAPVISQLNTPPITPSLGDRYLIGTSPTGAWAGRANQIAEWNGSTWVYTTPVTNNIVFITNTLTTLRFNGTSWVAYQGTAILQNGNSLGLALTLGTNDANTVSFRTSGVDRFRITAAGTQFQAVGISGSAALPIYSSSLSTGSGLWFLGTTVASISGGGTEVARFNGVASGVNYFNVTNSATGAQVAIGTAGSDTNIALQIRPKGTGALELYGGSGFVASINNNITLRETQPTATANDDSYPLIFNARGGTAQVQNARIFLDGNGSGNAALNFTLQNDGMTASMQLYDQELLLTGTNLQRIRRATGNLEIVAANSLNFSASAGAIVFTTVNTATTRMSISNAGLVTIANLTGTTSRLVEVNTGGTLSASVVVSSITQSLANSIKGNPTTGVTNVTDIVLTSNTILGRVDDLNSGNIGAIPIQNSIVGVDTLVGGTKTILDARIVPTSFAIVSYGNTGTATGILRWSASTGQITVTSSVGTDNSNFSYQIVF